MVLVIKKNNKSTIAKLTTYQQKDPSPKPTEKSTTNNLDWHDLKEGINGNRNLNQGAT